MKNLKHNLKTIATCVTSPPSSVGRAQGSSPCGRGFEPHGGCFVSATGRHCFRNSNPLLVLQACSTWAEVVVGDRFASRWPREKYCCGCFHRHQELQASECSHLPDPMRAHCWISTQHCFPTWNDAVVCKIKKSKAVWRYIPFLCFAQLRHRMRRPSSIEMIATMSATLILGYWLQLWGWCSQQAFFLFGGRVFTVVHAVNVVVMGAWCPNSIFKAIQKNITIHCSVISQEQSNHIQLPESMQTARSITMCFAPDFPTHRLWCVSRCLVSLRKDLPIGHLTRSMSF